MDKQSDKHILKALKISDILTGLGNNENALGCNNGCDVLFGVMRDCAYKIRRQAEREAHQLKGKWVLHAESVLVVFAVAILLVAPASPVNADIILSTNMTETLGGLSFGKSNLAEYNLTTDTASLYFDGATLFSGSSDIDAVHVLENGNIILSTTANATLGGLIFGDGDLVEYNPTTDTATLFLDESLFSSDEDIDAVHILDNGNIILSTDSAATLGGLNFGDGDLITYNPTTDIAILFFDESLFDGAENIDAVHILANGNIILSTDGAATLGGLTFQNGDLAEYNPTTDTATLYFDENLFSNNANINAVHISTMPEPATIALLGLGSVVLMRRRHR